MPGVAKSQTRTFSLTAEHAEDAEAQRMTEHARARALIAEGAAQLDRGEVVDGGEVFRRLAERHARRRKAAP